MIDDEQLERIIRSSEAHIMITSKDGVEIHSGMQNAIKEIKALFAEHINQSKPEEKREQPGHSLTNPSNSAYNRGVSDYQSNLMKGLEK